MAKFSVQFKRCLALASTAMALLGPTPALLAAHPSHAAAAPVAQTARPRFYRIIDGPHPGPAEEAADRFLYGTDILYTGDAKVLPTRVKGIVWHSKVKEAKYFLGDRNPVIEELGLMKALEDNKWEEAKLLQQYAPDAFPRTENMAAVLKETGLRDLRQLAEALRKRYPNGFFLKSVDGFDSGGRFPTEKTDFSAIYSTFKSTVEPKIKELLGTLEDETLVHQEMKRVAGYEGRFIDQLLRNPESMIIQEKLKPAFTSVSIEPEGALDYTAQEFRVHVAEGEVIRGATLNRFDYASTSAEVLRGAENLAQRVVNSLPPAYRKLCFAMDVLRTENGLFKIIELNVGGESGFLYPDYDVWITHHLAEHYRGEPTTLQNKVAQLKHASSLPEKERILAQLLSRKELRGSVAEHAPLDTLYTEAKSAFMDELRRFPTRDMAQQTLFTIRRFKISAYLNEADVTFMANLLGGSHLTANEAAAVLGLRANGKLMFWAPTPQIREALTLRYDDGFVSARLTRAVKARLRELGVDPTDTQAIERVTKELIDEHILTRRQLQMKPTHIGLIAREATEAFERGSVARLFYSGSKTGLLGSVLKSLFRRAA